jgi:hypothetical protein
MELVMLELGQEGQLGSIQVKKNKKGISDRKHYKQRHGDPEHPPKQHNFSILEQKKMQSRE